MIGGVEPDLIVPVSRTSPAVAAERPIAFHHEIVVRHVSLRRVGAARSSIDGISFGLKRGVRLGIVGSTGAGKSTLVELLLGVLPPQTGAIIIDGEPLCAATQRAWQEKISYVPQSPALFNDTVARNIAFGVPDEHIDMAELRQAAHMANIHRFIEDELPKGYDTVISDRGTSLSAGQQQRLAIARALYRRPELVVLDEATSALDTVTESLVTEAITEFGRNITVVIVAHRLSTVRNCDRILVLDQGRVIQDGAFEDLSKEPGQFRQQLGLANVVQGPTSVDRL
jgi:ABC-type multidrug transport system fused ATPase/permease subunit